MVSIPNSATSKERLSRLGSWELAFGSCLLRFPAASSGYDGADRLTSVTQGAASVELTYDAANRRSTLTLPNGIVVSYSYDADSQVTALSYTGSAGSLGNLTYTYDAAGRRAGVGGSWARTGLAPALAAATYDAANQLVTWTGRPSAMT